MSGLPEGMQGIFEGLNEYSGAYIFRIITIMSAATAANCCYWELLKSSLLLTPKYSTQLYNSASSGSGEVSKDEIQFLLSKVLRSLLWIP